MKTVIMAGGKGSRIRGIVSDKPKPMIPVCGTPVLERAIKTLASQGYRDIIITVSHLGSIIMDYFGNGSSLGVTIQYYLEEEPLGTAGALLKLKDQLTETFLLLNADIIFNVDLDRMIAFHKRHGGLATLFTHPNSHPYDSGLLIAEKDLSVRCWLSKEDQRPAYYKNRVNAGIHIIDPKIFNEVSAGNNKIDLDRHILKPLAGTGEMFCYDSPEYVKDMGTPERFYEAEDDIRTGKAASRNLSKKQKAVFLDRDGTINRYKGFLHKIEDFELLPGVIQAICKLNKSEYLVIVVTNQPVIARGELDWDGLDEIHNKMETLLGYGGAYIDGLYFCPHHPHDGYEGEVAELKIDCSCRKPKPGMLLEAAKDFNIDLSKSYMVGDGENDIRAGKNAGCKTVLINSEQMHWGEDICVDSLEQFVNTYLDIF